MSKAKREQNPIAQNLREFRQVAELLKREGLVISESNYKEVFGLLKRYQDLANYFDRNQKELKEGQIGELNKIKGNRKKNIEGIISAHDRQEMKRRALFIENDIIRREAKIKEEFERVEKRHIEARKQVAILWPEVKKAANEFINAGIKDMDDLLRKYKNLRTELAIHVNKLPNEERIFKTQEMDELSKQVNRHERELYIEIYRARKVIETAVAQAQRNVDKMSLIQMVQLMLPGLKEADILKIAQKAGILTLENGTVSESDVNLGTIVVKNIPLKNQTALMSVLLKELAIRGTEAGPLAQFIQAIEKNAEALVTGEKTYFSIAYETKHGELGSLHYNIHDLLNDPHGAISRLIFEMYKHGVDENSHVVMAFTSPEQVASLMLANGGNIKELTQGGNLQALTGVLLENSDNPNALARIVGHDVPVDRNTSEIILALNRPRERVGIEPSKVMELFQVVAVVFEARRILIDWVNAPARKREKDSEAILGGVNPLLLEGGRVKQVPGFLQILGPKEKPTVTVVDIDKTIPKTKEEELLNKKIQAALDTVDIALHGLKSKIGEINQHQYDKAYAAAKVLLNQLQEARDQYAIDLKNPEIKHAEAGLKFKAACKLAIDEAKPVLEKDLGWGDYLKNLLKVIANAIVIGLTLGISSGFFTTKRSESAKAVEQAEKDLELEQVTSSVKQCCK